MRRPKLSAAVITKNEEDKIADCLQSLYFADEIVVVDSGSTDRTVEIARSMGAKVIHNDWPGHIQQKNFAIDQTTGDWILSLDADERVSAQLRDEIIKTLDPLRAEGYAIPRLVYYINRWICHCGWYPARKVRLFKRGAGRWGGENPHDRVFMEGRVANLKGHIYHLSFDNISEHLTTIQSFTDIAAKERIDKGLTAGFWSMLLRPPGMFVKMYFLKLGFLDGIPGLIISLLSAYHVFSKYAKIWERSQR
ncbi:MAG: glycosyltransferase family 2 protein [Nitrospinae bacterium]|nr:glycosyltransferase family 2 protein [Nitrospinota bacterium]